MHGATDNARLSGIVVFIGHHSLIELLVFYYSFITEVLDEAKVKHISFVKQILFKLLPKQTTSHKTTIEVSVLECHLPQTHIKEKSIRYATCTVSLHRYIWGRQ